MPAYNMDYKKEAKKAKAGDLDAMFNMASYIVWNDSSAPLSPEEVQLAVGYYVANAAAGDTDSMLDLGAMYLCGRGVEKSRKKALEWYMRAARAGAPKAYRCLGNYYKYDTPDDGIPVQVKDEKRLLSAFGWFEKGADMREENSLYELGDFFRYGVCTDKDEKKAFELYSEAYKVIMENVIDDEMARNDSYADVCLRLAECFHYGTGTEADLDEAKKFIDIALNECRRRCEEGDMYGRASLERAEKEWTLLFQSN